MSLSFIRKIGLGFIIGVAAITPGLSGGVIAAAAGVYEPLLKSVAGLGKSFKKNIMFLLPYCIGGAAGVLLFGKVMESLLAYSYHEVLYIFSGLVLGTVPSFIKEANKKGYSKIYPFVSLIFCVISVFSGELAGDIGSRLPFGFLRLFVTGAILSVGTVVPGLSSSFILMKAGLYTEYISAISNADAVKIIYILLGFAAASLAIIKLINKLFTKFHGLSCYSVLGLLIGSLIMVFPGFREARKALVDFSLMYLSFVTSFLAMSFKRQA